MIPFHCSHSSPVRRTRSPFVWQSFKLFSLVNNNKSDPDVLARAIGIESVRTKCSSVNGSGDFLFSRQKRENKNGSLVDKEKDITRIWWEKTSRWYHSESFAISSGYKKQSSINVSIFIYLIYWLSVLSLLTLCIYSAIHFLDDISKYINNGICNNKKTKEDNSMVFANKRLLYLKFDGINFIVREIRSSYVLRIRVMWILRSAPIPGNPLFPEG